jgi:acyl-homoserine-lactone acylase
VPRHHRLRSGLLAGATAALLLAGLAGCTDDDEPASSSGDDNEQEASAGGYEATIRRTTDGVPHVTGATFADAAFGQGYASGQDRTCDLADQLVKIRGERARWSGAGEEDANLNSDIQWKTIGLFELAQQDWEELDPEVAAMFEAFAAGWNAHLEEVGVDELAGWCAGEPWVRAVEASEVYAYSRAIALNASGTRVGTYIATAQPPAAPDAESGEGEGDGADEGASALAEAPIASNGWAIGADRSTSGGGMLVANPHFPWEGELRFWEVQLTVPGTTDIYGVQLSGVPGIGIGFNEDFGWTHTVSAGNRFTAYSLDLVPGSPTTYRYGDEEREMTSETFTIEVQGDDGEVEEVEHTSWYSHYGPILDFPGYGWTDESTITYRDANIDNDEFAGQYYAMAQATTFDELIAAHEQYNGVPLFNTIATSADGRAWYADTSATPNLSDEALAGYEQSLEADPIVALAAQSGAVLLDGSDPTYEWVEVEGARDPGLVPYDEQPQVTREDYAFNANDSYWMPHASELLEGDYSPLHGRQDTPRSPRTRENATILDDTSAQGASGDDGTFTLDELADAALANTGFTSRALLDDVVARCSEQGTVTVPALEPEDADAEGLPAGEVDVSEACAVLAAWDGVYDVDRAGPPLWRELMSRYESTDFTTGTGLWAEPFDAAQPLATPSGLVEAPAAGDDPVVINLARAVQALELAGFAPDVTLGEAQFALRDGTTVPIHGGGYVDGTTNVVGFGRGWSILDPTLEALERDVLTEGSGLADIDDGMSEPTQGYLINNGTSFLMALAYGPDGPEAKVFLTYGNTEDRSSEDYPAVTERFSDKDWRTVAFTDDAIEDDATSTITVTG